MSAILLHLLFERLKTALPLECWRSIQHDVLKNMVKCGICSIDGFAFNDVHVEIWHSYDQYDSRGDWHGEKVTMCEECTNISEDFFDNTYNGFHDMQGKIISKKGG